MLKKLKVVLKTPTDLWLMFISYLPGIVGVRLRYKYWKKRLRFLGKSVKIDVGVYFQNPQFISIDNNCWIDRNVIILAGISDDNRIIYEKSNEDFQLKKGEVYIGRNTHIAPNCVLSGIGGIYIGKNTGIASNSAIYSFSHHYKNLVDRIDKFQYSFTPLAKLDQQSMILSPVVIEDFCALGLHSVVLPGTTLKKGSWVASGLVISGIYESQSLIYREEVISTKSLSHLEIKDKNE